MSEAREIFFEFLEDNGCPEEIQNFINELEHQNKELMKIVEDDYQYFALKNNPETGRAKFLKTIINKYK